MYRSENIFVGSSK